MKNFAKIVFWMTCGGIVYCALNAYYFPEEWKEYAKAMWKNVTA